MLEYSTEIDDSIPCHRSGMLHLESVEHSNILLITCHLSSTLVGLRVCVADRITLSRSCNLISSILLWFDCKAFILVRSFVARRATSSHKNLLVG